MTDAFILLGSLVAALILTILIEVAVARLFRLSRRGLLAVALVNLLTNPLLNFVIVVLALADYFAWQARTVMLPVTVALEVAIVFIEWQILVRVSAGTFGSSRRLLAFSVVANAVTALLPVVILAL